MREPVPNLDLFGAEGRTVYRGGYAADPGSGPPEETCGSCKHYQPGRYKKCALVPHTRGPATDILKSAPACLRWSAAPAPAPKQKPAKAPARARTLSAADVAAKAATRGMERAAARAERVTPEWMSLARGFLVGYAMKHPDGFLIEAAVAEAIENGITAPDARAWGAVVRLAASRREIEQTGRYARANTSNRSPKPLWRRATTEERAAP